jgi:hypothetical protein
VPLGVVATSEAMPVYLQQVARAFRFLEHVTQAMTFDVEENPNRINELEDGAGEVVETDLYDSDPEDRPGIVTESQHKSQRD